jgi:glycosyltransferase involved in cell wall biosynthesis
VNLYAAIDEYQAQLRKADRVPVKRVLFLIKGLAHGGAEQLLLNGIRYHDVSRFDYMVAYLLPSKNSLVEDLKAAGLPVFCLRGERGTGWVGRLRRLVEKQQIDLVHSHSPYAAVGARLGLKRHSPRHVHTEHSAWEGHHIATRWANLLTLNRSDHIFAVSQHVRKSIRYPPALRFLPMPPIETLYHGIDLSSVRASGGPNGIRREFGVAPGAPLIGSVSNFAPNKGQVYLLEALQRVRQAMPDVRAILVGQGPLESHLRQVVRRLGLGETVIFAGYRPDAPRIASAFDVFVLSSVNEGLSIALIEAMAQARPSVVTNAGGLPEVLRDGVEGLVVPIRDTRALAGGILALLGNPDLRNRMGEAARRRAQQFDISRAIHRMEEVYAELLT